MTEIFNNGHNGADSYGDSSISSLKGADQVRKKPSNIFGSSDIWGAFHSVTEILANSFDEVRAISNVYNHDRYDTSLPYKFLRITYSKDKVISVQDKGRGVPMAFNPDPKERKFNWHMVFSLLYAGGKYTDEEDEAGQSNYAESLGTNGLGCTATQYASEFFNVQSKRDGKLYKASFEKGIPLTNYIYNGQMVQFPLYLEFKEQYYIGAKIQAKTLDGKSVTVVLEDFNPYDRTLGYQVDFDTAERLGLQPITKKEQHPNSISLSGVSDNLVDNIFEKLYHTVLVAEDLPEESKSETGTLIEWKLDNEVFYNTDFTLGMFEELLETQAHVVSSRIEFENEYHNVSKVYQGISTEHLFRSRLGEDNIIDSLSTEKIERGYEAGKRYTAKGLFQIALTNGNTQRNLYLHNTALMTEEVHVSWTNLALESFFKDIGKKYGVDIKEHEYHPYFSVMIETYANANATSYKNQTKKGITNNYIGHMIYNTLKDLLEDAYAKQKQPLMDIITIVTTVAKDRVKSAEDKKKANLVKKTLSKRHTVEKISECESTKAEECELIIVEGDSAKAPVVNSRDEKTQAIYPAQGKVPNALKRTLEKLLQNPTIKDIISEIGVGVDIGNTQFGVYNYSKLRYNKIIIMTDADKDGYQIRVLLLLVFYVLMPDLLRKGHIYICETPFIRLTTGGGVEYVLPENLDKTLEKLQRDGVRVTAQNEVERDGEKYIRLITNQKLHYAYTLEERDEKVKLLASAGFAIQSQERIKGLGGFVKEELRMTAMSKENRRLIPLTLDTDNEVVQGVIDTLFGKDVRKMRKDAILGAIGVALKAEEDPLLSEALDDILDDVESEDTEEELTQVSENA